MSSSVQPPQIKICGVTSLEDAEQVMALHADFLGMIFVPHTPRYLTLTHAAPIANATLGKIKRVGVFLDQPLSMVEEVANTLKLDYVQLHGEESDGYIQQIKQPVIKVLPLTQVKKLPQPHHFPRNVEILLFDLPKGEPPLTEAVLQSRFDHLGLYEGTLPFMVAGKLTPENLQQRLHAFRDHPHFRGVDVASGVEEGPGKKDPEKLAAFFKAVRE